MSEEEVESNDNLDTSAGDTEETEVTTDVSENTDELQPEPENDALYDFMPEITIEPVTTGVIYLQITNCESMWEKNRYSSMHDVCFQFVYRKIKTNIYDTNNDIDELWKRRSILVGNTAYDGKLYIKVPIYLINYNIEFFIHCRNNKTNKFMTPSTKQTVNIPSFLVNNNYKLNDIIHFRDEQTFYTSQGKIVDILDDNKFKIFYYKYNEINSDDDTQAIEPTKESWIPMHEVIHSSRIYHKGTDLQYEIDLIDSDKMETNLLIKRNDIESKNIFNVLINIYDEYSFNWCIEQYGDENGLCHWEAVSLFITKNIFDFLFAADFNYKINCLLDGDSHSVLRLNNLRQSDIRTKLELQKNKSGNVEVDMDEFDELSYRCDCCRTGLRDWHFVYQCSTKPLDRHDFCLDCVNTVVSLNHELKSYLDEILDENVNNDCIQVIVSYVIGKVVCL
eukprot:529362_1